MFFKTTLTAGMLAVALAFSPVAAEAKTSVHIGIGTGWGGGWGGWGGGCYGRWSYRCGRGYGHGGFGHLGYYGYYGDPFYRPYVRRHARLYNRSLSCGAARAVLGNRGYRRIRARDCSGREYVFTAVKRGHLYRIRISSRNGAVLSVRRG